MLLEVNNISCGYTKNQSILSDVSFKLNSGEICCILGSNGVGKSTLFKSILNILPLQKGDIYVDGENTKKWSSMKQAKQFAYVSQFHVPPFPYKVKDVILMGRVSHIGYFGQPRKKDYDLVEEIMNDMGIFHLRNEDYTNISGGERQLVMFAKALVQEPSFLFLDEPTASLDYFNSIKVLSIINNISRKDIGVIMITHSPDQAFLSNSKALMITKSKTIIYGDSNNVITSKNLKDVYGANLRILDYMTDTGTIQKTCVPELASTI